MWTILLVLNPSVETPASHWLINNPRFLLTQPILSHPKIPMRCFKSVSWFHILKPSPVFLFLLLHPLLPRVIVQILRLLFLTRSLSPQLRSLLLSAWLLRFMNHEDPATIPEIPPMYTPGPAENTTAFDQLTLLVSDMHWC